MCGRAVFPQEAHVDFVKDDVLVGGGGGWMEWRR